MAKKDRSFAEKTYKAGILSGGAAYKIPPMTIITEKMKIDSLQTELNNEHESKDS